MKKKVAFCLERTYNSGGMERMLSTIANKLAATYQVTVISAFNNGKSDFFPLSSEITKIDLNINPKSFGSANKLKSTYKAKLSEYLHLHKQDITVSLGSSEFFFLPFMSDGSKKFFWFHFALNYDVVTSCSCNRNILNKIIGKVKQARRLLIAKKYERVIVLSQQDYCAWKKFVKDVVCINNPVTIIPEKEPDYFMKKALAVGRLEYQKGFDLLIDAWIKVYKTHPDWELHIIGDGSTKSDLERQIEKNGLSNIVFLKGRKNNMATEYPNYSFFVLSSRYEGFGLVLCEAAACGLPLISYNCYAGPSEIVNNNVNGILIDKVGDIDGLANAINELIENPNKRIKMGNAAKEIKKRLSVTNIVHQWIELIESV